MPDNYDPQTKAAINSIAAKISVPAFDFIATSVLEGLQSVISTISVESKQAIGTAFAQHFLAPFIATQPEELRKLLATKLVELKIPQKFADSISKKALNMLVPPVQGSVKTFFESLDAEEVNAIVAVASSRVVGIIEAQGSEGFLKIIVDWCVSIGISKNIVVGFISKLLLATDAAMQKKFPKA